MARDIVYVMFDIPKEMHRKLQLLAMERNCSQKSLLQEAVINYIQQAAELSPLCITVENQKFHDGQEPEEVEGMGGMIH